MLRPKPMTHVTLFGPKSYMKEVIDALYDLNAVHIEDYTKKSDKDLFDIGEPLEHNEKCAELLVKTRMLIANLGIQKKTIEAANVSLETIEKTINQIHKEVVHLLERKEYITKVRKIYSKKSVNKALSSLKLEEIFKLNEKKEKEIKEEIKDYLFYVGFIDEETELLKEEVEKITKKYILESVNYENLNVIALFCEPKYKDKISALLDEKGFSPIDTPLVKEKFPELKLKPGQKFFKLNHEEEILGRKLSKIDADLLQIKIQNMDFLLSSESRLKMETDKAEVPLRFATTKNTFLLKGWIPTENEKKLEERVHKVTNNKVLLKMKKAGPHDEPPIAFNHPKIVEPFEAFMDLYTLPSYREIDPTFFLFLTFPIFFGFMLGDFGYGLVIFILFSILKAKIPSAKNILNAFIIAAIVSMAFGMVFGEYFGYEEVSPQLGKALGIKPKEVIGHGTGEKEIIYPIPHLVSRSHQKEDIISAAILFGIVHILIGLLIGFYNVYSHHGLKHAIMEKGGWILLMPGITWLLVYFLGVIKGYIGDMLKIILPPLPIIGVLSGIAVLLIVIGEGARGAVELPGIVSNILSYARLMAVGLASLLLAMVVNQIAGQLFKAGVGGIIGGIFVLVLGHTINIALGILSPFLHAIRLHYVEFFGKFLHGGGKKYKSFGG